MRRFWLALLALAAVAGVLSAAAAAWAQSPRSGVGVYYVGPQDAVARAIQAAQPYLRLVDRPELADVYVLNDVPLERGELVGIGRQVINEDAGLVVFSGSQFPAGVEDLRALLGVGTFGFAQPSSVRSVREGDEPTPLQTAVAWRSAPEVRARTVISNPNLLLPVVETENGEPVLQQVRRGERYRSYFFGVWTSEEENPAWQTWPYFDYLVYYLVAEAGNATRVLPYGDYPWAPVPHGQSRLVLMVAGAVVFGSTLAVLYLARRALYLRPSILPPLPSRAQPSAQTSLVGWSKIGFHRPLAGTLFLLGVGLVIGVPLLLYDATFLRQVLIPEQQVFTFWEQVLRWLRVVWVLLDLGIGVTAVRFFALCRLRDRRQGYRYFQFYIWWQLVSGAVQLGLTLWLSAFFLPFTSLAHLSFYFVARMLLQFPGFLYVFRLLFRAFQRFDYEQLLTAVSLAATVVLQTLMVITLRAWGGVRPGIGAQVGSVLGLGAGQVLSSLLIFLLGSWLYKRAGYSLRWLFLPAFDLSIIARALGFGARLAFGSLAIPAVGWAQSYLLPRLFPDFGRLAGDLTLITLLVVGYELLAVALYDAMIPTLAVAEAQHYGSLKRYYATQGVRYGFWFSAFFLAVLAALGLPFLNSVLGEVVQIAPELFYGLLIWGAFQWLPWSAERSLVAVGRPALRSWLLLGGQLLRLILLWLFVPRLGTWGVPVAYLLALLGRGGTGWIITRRAAVRAPLPGWQGIVAPAGAALLIYNVLQGLVDLAWPLGAQGAVWLVILTLPPTLALYAFFTGLLGGWDEGGIQELAEAMRISSIGVPVGWLMLWGVRFGARISPLHDAFPMKLRTLAAEEAEALTLRYPPA